VGWAVTAAGRRANNLMPWYKPERPTRAYTTRVIALVSPNGRPNTNLPCLAELGERWQSGEVSVGQEHFASNLLRGRLLSLAQGWGQGSGPRAVLAALPASSTISG
jgi:hypothetical protein